MSVTTPLIDVIDDLKSVLDRLGHDYSLLRTSGGEPELVGDLLLPRTYRLFLEHFAPNGGEIRFAQYHTLTFFMQEELESAQSEALNRQGLLTIGLFDEQPLLLKISGDTEVDGGVFRLLNGESLRMAGSLLQFLRIFQLALEMLGALSDFDEVVPGYQEEEEFSYHDSYEDAGAVLSREELLDAFYRELEMIDPDGVENWNIDQ